MTAGLQDHAKGRRASGNDDAALGPRAAYERLLARLPALVAAAPLTLCGMGACVDARVSMHDMQGLLNATDPAAAALAALLTQRAAASVGGEVFVDWADGPAWLGRNVPVRYALGGTGPQAGWVLTEAGAPALVALQDRSAHMAAQLPPGLLLAEAGAPMMARQVTPRGTPRADIFIFEYTAGRPIGALVPSRSSRIIVRFSNHGLEHDDDFDRLSIDLAGTSGAGLLSGFSSVPAAALAAETTRLAALGLAWREAGLTTVHLELAGYDTPQMGKFVLDGMRGAITSVGMSHSEFVTMDQGDDLAGGMAALAQRLEVSRVCVHADHWAAAATLGDPDIERDALMMGCLLSSARAAAGVPVRPARIDARARFELPPYAQGTRHDAWHIVSCPSPYLDAPETTLGLGDTFTAGCLLVLGQPGHIPGGATA